VTIYHVVINFHCNILFLYLKTNIMLLLDSYKEVAPWTTLLVCVTKTFMFVDMRWGNTTSTRPWTTLVWSSCMMYLKLMPTHSVRCWNTVMVMTWTSISNRWAPNHFVFILNVAPWNIAFTLLACLGQLDSLHSLLSDARVQKYLSFSYMGLLQSCHGPDSLFYSIICGIKMW